MNKCGTHKIQPLLVDNVFVLNCEEKAKKLNDYISKQFTLIMNISVLPTFNFLTDKRIDYLSIQTKK